MRLTQLFAGEKQVDTREKNRLGNTSFSERQIRAFTPGQTLRGEVLSKNGSEVQIKLSDDFIIHAKIERNMNLEVGKSMTFEVKNNGSSLTLSPLFENTATDANVLKALDMASLPVNDTTISMTAKLMEAGLPIDKNSLLQVYREINGFPQASVEDVVDLHKLGIPVDEGSLNQIAAYKNFNHKLEEGMQQIADGIPRVLEGMIREGNVEGAAKLWQEVFLLLQEGEMTPGTENRAGTGDAVFASPAQTAASHGADQGANVETGQGEPGGQSVENGQTVRDGQSMESILTIENGRDVQGAGTEPNAQTVPGGNGGVVHNGQETQKNLQGGVPLEEGSNGQMQNSQAMQSNAGSNAGTAQNTNQSLPESLLLANRLFQSIKTLSDGDMAALRNLIRGKEFGQALGKHLQNQWKIAPKEVAIRGEVEKLYNQIDRQMRVLGKALEDVGQTGTQTFKAVNQLSQNLDFLQQLNQAYTYVQFPLRLQQGKGHGDLYVFTNKKHLAVKEGQISALLHLDMEHIGCVDVYVAMRQERVSTRFFVQDEEMLDFLEERMDLLTKRLQRRGYECSFAMEVRNKQEENAQKQPSAITHLLQKEGHVPLARYAFDMRA